MLYTSSKGTATHVQSQPTLSAQSKTACSVASVCFYLTKPFVFENLYDSGSPSLEMLRMPRAVAELFWLPPCNEMQALECTKTALADVEGTGHDTNKLNSGCQKKHGILGCVGHD